MPIGNMLAQFGNRPSLMQDVEGLRGQKVMNRLGEYKLGAAIRDEQKQNRLSELYSRGVSGDKAAFNEMASVSPEFHMQIQKQLMDMDKTQREQLQAQMAETGRVAIAARANPQLWAQEFPDIPYEQADVMLAKLSASKDVFDAIQEQEKTQYGRFKDDRAYALDQAQFGETQRHNQASEYATLQGKNAPTDKMREAESLGYKPGTPQYENYMKGGSRGALSATAQKELFEADETAQSSQSAIMLLNEAKSLNDQAYSGFGAKARATIASNLPGQYGGADATIQLDNLMTSQALESLKGIFGGMPTEGERKILMDMQASADKTPGQRQEIISRAIAAAQRRAEFNQKKAESLRSGNYFTDQAGSVSVTMPKPGEVQDGWVFKGGDPADRNSWVKQ